MMEPASAPPKRKGKKGSLDNPELLENVPGHVIPILEREFDDFDNEAHKFLAGDTAEDQFIGFRLKQGVYGQRQADVQMIRVKLPFGGITPEQMEAFADVVEKYAPLNKGHLTTLQNIQLHHIALRDAAEAIRKLSDSGLSSREGCGNTVRNVTGDPWAGVCEGELFDPTPYVGAYVRYFVRHPTTQLMPRKVKTAFTATDEDRAITGIHDIGFIPRVREIEGRGEVRGVEVRVGGGTSIMPRIAPTLYEFVELDNGDYLKVSEAVFRIFDRQDWLRVNRARARIKVLIDKIGIDEFRDQVEEELKGDWTAERDFDPQPRLFVHDEEAHAPELLASYAQPNGDGTKFERFRADNVRPQRQAGFSTVHVKVTRGDLTPEQFRGLGQIMRDYSGGYARTTVEQNRIEDELTRRIHIKMSGCRNGCSQHHIANIGFYGASIKVGDKTIPAYIPHIAGNYEGGEVVYGERLKSRLPAKRVPDAVERWVRAYEEEREQGEVFNAYAARVGSERFEELVKDLALPVEFNVENLDHFIDWQRRDLYQVIRGEGECA